MSDVSCRHRGRCELCFIDLAKLVPAPLESLPIGHEVAQIEADIRMVRLGRGGEYDEAWRRVVAAARAYAHRSEPQPPKFSELPAGEVRCAGLPPGDPRPDVEALDAGALARKLRDDIREWFGRTEVGGDSDPVLEAIEEALRAHDAQRDYNLRLEVESWKNSADTFERERDGYREMYELRVAEHEAALRDLAKANERIAALEAAINVLSFRPHPDGGLCFCILKPVGAATEHGDECIRAHALLAGESREGVRMSEKRPDVEALARGIASAWMEYPEDRDNLAKDIAATICAHDAQREAEIERLTRVNAELMSHVEYKGHEGVGGCHGPCGMCDANERIAKLEAGLKHALAIINESLPFKDYVSLQAEVTALTLLAGESKEG